MTGATDDTGDARCDFCIESDLECPWGYHVDEMKPCPCGFRSVIVAAGCNGFEPTCPTCHRVLETAANG